MIEPPAGAVLYCKSISDSATSPVLDRYLHDSRMARVWREIMRCEAGGRGRGTPRYVFGIDRERQARRDAAVAFRNRAAREGEAHPEWWLMQAEKIDQVAELGDADLAIYSTTEAAHNATNTQAVPLAVSMRIWPLFLRPRLLMRDDPNVVSRVRSDLSVTGFCVAVSQHLANLTGQKLGGTVAILCEVTHGNAPTRAAILKMTEQVKPLKERSKIVC